MSTSSQNKRKAKRDVDDEYAGVTTTSKREKTVKSGPSKRGAEAEEETEKDRRARLAKERKKAWKDEAKKMIPWKYTATFVIPQGVKTILKGDAKKNYKLNDGDLKSLPYEQRLGMRGYTMKLYSLPQVQDICRRKHGPEAVDGARNLVEYPDRNHDGTGATIARLTKKGREFFDEREENEARKNRQVLTDCLTLWVPDHAETPASYELPTFECTKSSLPNNFAMRPGSRLITELEAMNLFLLRRCELEGLKRRSINNGFALDSPEGLNYNEVQQRAMDCHGGFDGHNQKVLDLSNTAVSKNYWDWGTFPEDLMIEFALSPIALKNKCDKTELNDKAFLEVWWPPYDPIGDQFTRVVCAPGHCDGCRIEAALDFVV
ncbi:uncharacterized protein EV420DRAFT_1645482 [Desarmillaria tabescens]|uniref:Uncharacterized protein n=1 Tax=Armillaria tabescens TaxID=1929756 RepID=A0AA39K405_ARMTA|nr:uncharacterized protein EV420DRAFT_1645482 [Desarmillaria tabescens]KAK0452951.1 hypothetical protein EV420DRAFT_1645482 [Desarmillaria tabescens]